MKTKAIQNTLFTGEELPMRGGTILDESSLRGLFDGELQNTAVAIHVARTEAIGTVAMDFPTLPPQPSRDDIEHAVRSAAFTMNQWGVGRSLTGEDLASHFERVHDCTEKGDALSQRIAQVLRETRGLVVTRDGFGIKSSWAKG